MEQSENEKKDSTHQNVRGSERIRALYELLFRRGVERRRWFVGHGGAVVDTVADESGGTAALLDVERVRMQKAFWVR